MSSANRDLTTTSYALLGLLAVRSWSTYELAVQMRRNVHYFWPRTESNLYAEAKRLEAARLVTSSPEPVGRRRRTVYTITDGGMLALQHWLSAPSARSQLEAEVMVKLMFGNHGNKADVLANLRAYRADLEARLAVFVGIFGEYTRNLDPFPERLHINVLCYRLLWELARTELRWTKWASDRIELWPNVAEPGERGQHLAVLEKLLVDQTSGKTSLR